MRMANSFLSLATPQQAGRRPTVLDRRFRGDAWVEDAHDGTLSLCLGNYPLAALHALTLDQPHLNQVLDRLRQPPRTRA
jgi:hypothetical protein